PWLQELGIQPARLRAWGSVLTTAFDLALQMGCDPIVFAGADLAYTEGLLYCRNTVYEPEWKHLTTNAERAAAYRDHLSEIPTLMTSDVCGEPVLTAPHFLQFRDWLVSAASAGGTGGVNGTGPGIPAG